MKDKKPTVRQGVWKGGIWVPTRHINPKGNNQHTPKEVTVIKPLTDLEKYQKACDIREQIEKHKVRWTKLRKEYRGLTQKMGIMYKEMESYLIKQ